MRSAGWAAGCSPFFPAGQAARQRRSRGTVTHPPPPSATAAAAGIHTCRAPLRPWRPRCTPRSWRCWRGRCQRGWRGPTCAPVGVLRARRARGAPARRCRPARHCCVSYCRLQWRAPHAAASGVPAAQHASPHSQAACTPPPPTHEIHPFNTSQLCSARHRAGPNPKLQPSAGYHWFDGDGMIHAVRFSGGKASYCNRWVDTARLEQEQKAGWPLVAKSECAACRLQRQQQRQRQQSCQQQSCQQQSCQQQSRSALMAGSANNAPTACPWTALPCPALPCPACSWGPPRPACPRLHAHHAAGQSAGPAVGKGARARAVHDVHAVVVEH